MSGNVGKTTVAGQLLFPRIPGITAENTFQIETLNSGAEADGLDFERVKGKKFGELLNRIMMLDSAIVDVGASNAEDFLKLMQQYDGSQEEFDYFVVPTTKEKKVLADTVKTITVLKQIGVPKTKIRVIFNKVEIDDVVEDDFAALYGLAELEKSFRITPGATIYANEGFELIKSVKKSLREITEDNTDYRSKLAEVKGKSVDEAEHCIMMISLKRLAVTINNNLDQVYKVLFNK